MAMRNRNIMGNGDAGARLLWQAREDVSSALLGVGFLTCVTAVRAAAASSASGTRTRLAESVLAYSVYLGLLAGCFAGGLATVWAAGWVAGSDGARRRATGRIILCVSLVPMLVAFGLSYDSAEVFFDILRIVA